MSNPPIATSEVADGPELPILNGRVAVWKLAA